MNIKKKNLISKYINNCFSQKDKKGIRAVVTEFKKNADLKEAYYAINNLQYGVCSDVDSYIQHNKNVYLEHKNGFDSYKHKLKDISRTDKSIAYILENQQGASNYDTYQNHYERVKEHLNKNKVLRESQTKIKKMLAKLKGSSDQAIFKQLCEAKNKEDFFISYRDNVIMKINDMLSEENNKDQKLLLYEAKEGIKEKLFTKNRFVQDIMYIKKLEDILNG